MKMDKPRNARLTFKPWTIRVSAMLCQVRSLQDSSFFDQPPISPVTRQHRGWSGPRRGSHPPGFLLQQGSARILDQRFDMSFKPLVQLIEPERMRIE